MNNLPYVLHGATLALAWFMLSNLALTVAVVLVAARLTARTRATSPGMWLALRLCPSALSLAFVAVVFLPSYWKYEPRQVEGFDVTLTLLAMLALAMIGAGAARGVAAWRRAARRTEAWMGVAQPLSLPDTTLPAFAIDSDTPVMALVGILRPRLLITRPVLEALTDEELRASVAHELGHSRGWDNLKRLAMRAAPDMLRATSAARAIERRWAVDSEHMADRGAGDSRDARCALASALVKVARLTPQVTLIAEPISALMDGGDITARVQHLLDDAPAVRRRAFHWLTLAIPAAAIALAYTPLLRSVHEVTEVLVNRLP
jgi:Zn-dependent protease with chaperone function